MFSSSFFPFKIKLNHTKKMGSRGLLLLKVAVAPVPTPPKHHFRIIFNFNNHYTRSGWSSKMSVFRNCSTTTASSLEPPDVPRLAETARISLTPHEVDEFAPKIRQVIGWFGQLQAVDLNSVDPAIRADNETENLREDSPEIFKNREAIIAAIPSYEEPYIKVPKVINKE